MGLISINKSDNLIFMAKTMTATEVARNFSEVLDTVANGETIEITRGKAVLAVLAPKASTTWEDLIKAARESERELEALTGNERLLVASLDQEVSDFRYSDAALATDRTSN